MESSNDLTTLHVHRARDGEQESLAWLIARFSPLLYAQASYRLRGSLRQIYDPEDLVADVWATVLPRFGDLRERSNRLTPVMLKFLSTTLLNKANRLIEKHLTRPRQIGSSESPTTSGSDLLERLPADITHASTLAQRDEAFTALQAALNELDEQDREVLVLRGIEQISNDEAAQLLGVTPGAATRRYQRALDKIRVLLPGSVLDELPDAQE
jgi:RNA polymerase sigma-70 factor (ECF subfamily)